MKEQLEVILGKLTPTDSPIRKKQTTQQQDIDIQQTNTPMDASAKTPTPDMPEHNIMGFVNPYNQNTLRRRSANFALSTTAS
jgi:hypothetical protein